MTGIYFMIVVNICLSLVKVWPWILFALPLLVVAVVLHATSLSLFKRPWSLMSLKEASELDARDGPTGVSPAEAQQAASMYLSPSLRGVDAEEHRRVLAQAAAVDARARLDPSSAAAGELDLGQDMGPFVDQGPEWEADVVASEPVLAKA
jgi:biopolymer transport protein ExbB/TolQ